MTWLIETAKALLIVATCLGTVYALVCLAVPPRPKERR